MKHLIRVTAAFVMVLPFFASAQGADLNAQAQALLLQIQQLQAQLGGGANGGSGACYSGGPIKPGTSGARVSALQQFLAADPSVYPQGTVSGYYGALTVAAVQRFQVKNGIVTSGSPSSNGYGAVGPRTASAMAASCGGGDTSDDPVVAGFIKVSPISGNAPLSVTVETTINSVKSCLPAIYTLSWGDNSMPLVINVPANKCDVLAQTYSHLYTLGGEYHVTLSSGEHQTSSTVTVSGNGTMMSSGTLDTTTAGGSTIIGGTSGTTQPVSGALGISMGGNSFSPKSVTVLSGTRITWTNTDSIPHTVTADNGSYNSGALAPGQTYALTFSAKGEYTYYCALHGSKGGVGMSGKIIVQ